MMGDKKIGVFVYLAEEKNQSFFQEEGLKEKIPKIKSVEDFRIIKDDLDQLISAVGEAAEKGLTGLVVAHCCNEGQSQRIHDYVTTIGLKNTVVIDLYKEILMPNHDQSELANARAIDFIRLGISTTKKDLVLKEDQLPSIEKSVAVIGGGIAGISSAIELAKNNVKVYVIERESALGGHLRDLYKIYPLLCPAQCSIEFHVPMLEGKENVNIFLNSHITGIKGYGGNYNIEFESEVNASTETNSISVGSIILATGWKPFDASLIPNYGYGKYDNVITNFEFEKNEIREKVLIKGNDKSDFTVLFVQCVGSRDQRYLPYCSGVCCNVTLKQIDYVKEIFPDAKVYVSYIDLRTPQTYELFYQSIAEKYPDIVMIRGKPGEILRNNVTGKLNVDMDDTTRNERISLDPDLIVLATGMVPNNKEVSEMLGLPLTASGFPENHIQCNPYLSQGNGIYFAGSSMAPMDISSSIMSSLGATMKSYTYINRTKNELKPLFDTTKCDVCKRCIEECPQKALHLGSSQFPEVSFSGCEGCGVCMGACPKQAVSLPSLNPSLVNGWISILSKTVQKKEEPLVLAFMCKNDAYPLLEKMVKKGFQYPANYRIVPVPCAGSVNMKWVSEALIKGIDAVLVIGCKESQCHYVTGSKLASVRVENFRNTLEDELKIGGNKLSFENISLSDEEKFSKVLHDFLTLIRKEKTGST